MNTIGIGEVDSAVITVPTRFSEAARNCSEAAATYAYIDDVLLVPEPSAACVAHDIGNDSEEIERVVVYDLADSTFDLNIVNVVPDSEWVTDYVVQKTGGSQNLGGEDFDERLQEYLIEEFEAAEGVSLDDTDNPHERRARIRATAKEVKEHLSNIARVTATEPVLGPNGENMKVEVTREKFRELTSDLIGDTIEICEEVFDDLGYPPSEVDTVLTVGGSTKMPQVEEAVTQFFDQESTRGVDPDEAVALGAAEIARRLQWDEAEGETNDDETVLSSGEISADPFLFRDIGIELGSGKFEVLFEAGTFLPTSVSTQIATEKSEQESATLRAFRSKRGVDSDIAKDHEHIRTFEFDSIQSAPSGEPNIAVRFEMDRSGTIRAETENKQFVDTSPTDNEIQVKPKVDSRRVSDSPTDVYSPPDEDVIREIRDDLPPVRISNRPSYSLRPDSDKYSSEMDPEADDLYQRLGLDPIASMAEIHKQIACFQVKHGSDYTKQKRELERNLKNPERRREYSRDVGYQTDWEFVGEVVELQIHGPDVVEKNEPVTIAVTDEDGDPVSEVDINVGSTELGETDESGQISFSFDSPAPGEVTVTASKTTSSDRWFREDTLILTIPK